MILIILTLILILLLILLFKSKSNFDNFYNGDKWNEYRLADVYYKANLPIIDVKYHITKYPGSIASEIMKVKPYKPENKELLLNIISKKQKYTIPDNTLVLHIRAGDVMCIPKYKHHFLNYTKKGNNIWWNNVLNYTNNNNINIICIIAGSHKKDCLSESMDYLSDRKQFFEKNGKNVFYRLGQPPDDDFIYCLNAKHFISTGGGFGNLISEIKKN